MTLRYKEHNTDQITQTTRLNLSGSTTYTSQVSHVHRGHLVGENLHDYHKRVRRGELLPHTAFVHTEERGDILSSSFQVIRNSDQAYSEGVGLFTTGEDPGWMSSASVVEALAETYDFDALVQRSAAKIYANGHDTLTFLAELKKSVALFKNARAKLIKLLQAIRKRNIFDLTDFWLEYRYGWRILYYDIVEISETLASLEGKRSRFTERSGRSLSDKTVDVSYHPWVGGNQINTSDISWEMSVRGSVTADIEPPSFQFNPGVTAWELIRFSFIIDWFIDVGQWLESMSFLTLARNHAASGGYHIKYVKTYTEHDTYTGPYTGQWNVSTRYEAVSKIRTPTSVSLAPQVGINLDFAKGLDILSIVKGLVNGSPNFGKYRL